MSDTQRKYTEANRGLWNGWAKLHKDSAFYDVPAFKAGQSTLKHVELKELGDVAGKRLLHLQCHFGLDTLSWARRGAIVTGVDFAPDSIAQAKALGEEIGVAAEFLVSDALDLPAELDNRFDIVFTSYGALPWLGDLNRWANGIARCLAPGGVFYMVEFHPFLDMLDANGEQIAGSYFGEGEPEHTVSVGSYAAPDFPFTHENYQWFHPLGEVVSALAGAGLRLEFLHEFDHSVYNCYPFLVEREPGKFVLKAHPAGFPLMYSLKAGKG